MDKMREEFEDWFFSEVDGSVADESLCWRAWQASRVALVVELPKPAAGCSSFETLYTEDVCNALDEAGVSYK